MDAIEPCDSIASISFGWDSRNRDDGLMCAPHSGYTNVTVCIFIHVHSTEVRRRARTAVRGVTRNFTIPNSLSGPHAPRFPLSDILDMDNWLDVCVFITPYHRQHVQSLHEEASMVSILTSVID